VNPQSPDARDAAGLAATSVCLWGPDRAAVDAVGQLLARGIASRWYWLDVQLAGPHTPPGPASPPEPSEEPARTPIPPAALTPNHAMGDLRHWTIVVEPTGSPEGQRLADHARMPELLRRLMERHDSAAGPAALLVSNVDRGADRLYPPEPGTFRAGLATLRRVGISLIVTIGRPPRPNMDDFDHEFRVDIAPGAGSATVTCVRARDGYGAPFVAGGSWPVAEFGAALAARGTFH
jgi:hypothetical protein